MKIILQMLSILFSFVGLAEPAHCDSIMIRFHGGGPQSYVNDQLKVSGTSAELKTYSPFPYSLESANRAGTFTGPLSSEEQARLSALTKPLLKKSTKDEVIPQDAVVVEFSMASGGKTYVKSWSLGSNARAVALEYYFLNLKKTVNWKPLAALELSCKKGQERRLKCVLKNLGTENIPTIDPIAVSGSLSCVTKRGQRFWLNQYQEYNPKKMRPKTIAIPPKQSYEFESNLDPQCDGRIVMKTTDMMVNEEYKTSFLAELVSNELTR